MMVRYTLMHKEVCVAEMELDETTGYIKKIGELYSAEHLPVGIAVKKNIIDRAALNEWWIDRSIPASRSGIKQALEVFELSNTKVLLMRCFGLSLSDQYWIRSRETNITWKEINFFDNPFSEDIGDVLIGKTTETANFDFRSPDNTSDGCLKKRWESIDGKRCLVKGGSNPFMQQPFNEVIATRIMECLGIEHIPYKVMWDGDKPYSVCEDFITADTELVSAWRVMQTQKRDNSTSVYRHYVNCCEALGIKNIVHSIDQMIVLDYIIANEDRHQNNFGLVRNANTLEWIGAAPIFDSGSSLGYDKRSNQIVSGKEIECKPFKKTHTEQLKLVSSFDWIKFDRLNGIGDEIAQILNQAGEYMDENRKQAIISSVEKRINDIETIALSQTQVEDDIESDVEENIAETYENNLSL